MSNKKTSSKQIAIFEGKKFAEYGTRKKKNGIFL